MKKKGTQRETSIPIDAACGTFEDPQEKKRYMHVDSPSIDAVIAPGFCSFLEKRPHMNGPRNTEAIAPQEIESIVTITAGFSHARIIDRSKKNPLLNLPSLVREVSEACLLMKPW